MREHAAVHPSLHPVASVLLANTGILESAIAPIIGKADFAAFLKKSRRDFNSSFLFDFISNYFNKCFT